MKTKEELNALKDVVRQINITRRNQIILYRRNMTEIN